MKLLDISDEEYHSRKEWSSSDLKYLVHHSLNDLARHKETFKKSDAMKLGSAVHKYALEGSKVFFNEYAVKPEFQPKDGSEIKRGWKNTNDYKEQNENWLKIFGEKEILEEEDMVKVINMDKSFKEHPFIAECLTKKVFYEKSIIGEVKYKSDIEDEVKTLPVRCKFDMIIPDFCEEYGVIIDLKKTKSATLDDFGRDIYSYNYELQDLFYKTVAEDLLGKPFRFYFACVEDIEPHLTCVYSLSERRNVQALKKLHTALNKIERKELKRPSELGIEEI